MPHTIDHEGHTIDLTRYRESLIVWGTENFRPYPWREDEDPFLTLISEIMLHRTRSDQVAPVYTSFSERYSCPEDVIEADREDIAGMIQSLGLHSRTDRIINIAHILQEDHDGDVPEERDSLLALPGVGPYIAGAVRCFAYHEIDTLPDTNTLRVTSRLFGIDDIDNPYRSKTLHDLIERMAMPEQTSRYYYSLLDLAALVCHPSNPECSKCPVREWCQYSQT